MATCGLLISGSELSTGLVVENNSERSAVSMFLSVFLQKQIPNKTGFAGDPPGYPC